MSVETSKPFYLRCLQGKNKGRYLVRADYEGAETTDDVTKATKFSVENAYGNIAAALDMLCTTYVPENSGSATDDDYRAFGERAANDMFQKPGPKMIELMVRYSCRKSAEESLAEPDLPPLGGRPYLSVWEWCHRAWFAGLEAEKKNS